MLIVHCHFRRLKLIMSKECKCESWCYCIRPSLKKEIDKIPFIDSRSVIKERVKYWKFSSADKYDQQIARFIYDNGD